MYMSGSHDDQLIVVDLLVVEVLWRIDLKGQIPGPKTSRLLFLFLLRPPRRTANAGEKHQNRNIPQGRTSKEPGL
jgi:hypothetical protein